MAIIDDFITQFETTSEFNRKESTLPKPHVALTLDNMVVHYMPLRNPSLVITYHVENSEALAMLNNAKGETKGGTRSTTGVRLYNYTEPIGDVARGGNDGSIIGVELFYKIEIDGMEANIADIDSHDGWVLLEEGDHTVEYTLKDITFIINYLFSNCTSIVSVDIPEGVIEIGAWAFKSCYNLQHISFPSTLTEIDSYSFCGCDYVDSESRSAINAINNTAFDCGGPQ